MDDEDKIIIDTLHRKIAFIDDRKRSLGPEYYASKDFWDRMWEMEWEQLETMLREPPQMIEEMTTVPTTFPKIDYQDKALNLYSYSDFSMLHNQGIFRAELFFIDRTGNWTKKVVREMTTYGYKYLKTINKHLLFGSADYE
jgi:hypothetical protein|tara:strand:- start:12061 stop:12483 length:423 start_codon:yes stop_codon:yes gene_type:complete